MAKDQERDIELGIKRLEYGDAERPQRAVLTIRTSKYYRSGLISDAIYTCENWQEVIEAMQSGAMIEISEDVFDYFLDVLPPVYMGRTLVIGGEPRFVMYGFAEGAEPITAFWRKDGRYFCQRTTEVNRGY